MESDLLRPTYAPPGENHMDSPEFLYVQPRTEAVGRRTMGLSVPTANEFTVRARVLVAGCRVRVSRVLDGETFGLDEPPGSFRLRERTPTTPSRSMRTICPVVSSSLTPSERDDARR